MNEEEKNHRGAEAQRKKKKVQKIEYLTSDFANTVLVTGINSFEEAVDVICESGGSEIERLLHYPDDFEAINIRQLLLDNRPEAYVGFLKIRPGGKYEEHDSYVCESDKKVRGSFFGIMFDEYTLIKQYRNSVSRCLCGETPDSP